MFVHLSTYAVAETGEAITEPPKFAFGFAFLEAPLGLAVTSPRFVTAAGYSANATDVLYAPKPLIDKH